MIGLEISSWKIERISLTKLLRWVCCCWSFPVSASVRAVEWTEPNRIEPLAAWWCLLALQQGFTPRFGLFPAQSFQVSECVPYSHYSWWSTLLRTSARLLVFSHEVQCEHFFSVVFSASKVTHSQKKAKNFSDKLFLQLYSLFSCSD